IGRNAHFGRVHRWEVELALLDGKQAALVGDFVVEHAKEWLLRIGTVTPMAGLARCVPRLPWADGRIVVCLGVVRRVIAGLAQMGRKALEPGWDVVLGAHVLSGAASDGVHAGDE